MTLSEVDFLHLAIVDRHDPDATPEWIVTNLMCVIDDGPGDELAIILPFETIDGAIAGLRRIIDELEYRKGDGAP